MLGALPTVAGRNIGLIRLRHAPHHPLQADRRLAKRGFYTIAVEYRLSGEAPVPAAIYDIKACVRWIRTNAARYKFDANAIRITGGSAGGHLSVLTAVTNSDSRFEGTANHLTKLVVISRLRLGTCRARCEKAIRLQRLCARKSSLTRTEARTAEATFFAMINPAKRSRWRRS